MTRPLRPARRGPAILARDGLLLFLTLTGVMLFCLRSYAFGLETGRALGLCAGLAALSLAVFSLPRYRRAALLALLGLSAALIWRAWPSVWEGARAVYSTAAGLLTDAVGFPGYVEAPPVADPEARLRAVWHCVAAAGFALALLLGWAVVRLRRGWAVFLLSFPWLLPALLCELPMSWAALALLAACWLAMALASLAAREDPVGGARLTLLALPAAALLLALLLAAFPRAEYARPAWTLTARARIEALGARAEASLFSGGGLFSDGGGLFDALGGDGAAAPRAAGRVDLAGAGPCSFTGRTVLLVESSLPGWTYLRGAAAARYTGTAWEPHAGGAADALEAAGDGQAAFLPGLAAPGAGTQTVRVTGVDAPLELAYYPYQPLDAGGARESGDAFLSPGGALWSYSLDFAPAGTQAGALSGRAEEREAAYREAVYAHYLDVPAETAEALRQWLPRAWQRARTASGEARAIAAPGARYQETLDAAAELVRLVQLDTAYDDQTPAMPAGADFVTYFLEESRRGYCMHYASAVTLLLRLEGIPARYVSGYAFRVPESGELGVADSAAHAWVELYLDGYGWFPLEATPAASGLDAEALQAGPAASPSPAPSAAPTPATEPTPSPAPLATPSPGATPTPAQSGPAPTPVADGDGPGPDGSGAPDLGWLRALLAPLSAIGLLYLARLLLRRRRARLLATPDNGRAAIAAYALLRRLAPWGAKPGARAEALVRKARFSRDGLDGAERAAILDELAAELRRLDESLPPLRRLAFHYLHVFDRPWRRE